VKRPGVVSYTCHVSEISTQGHSRVALLEYMVAGVEDTQQKRRGCKLGVVRLGFMDVWCRDRSVDLEKVFWARKLYMY
jgi:hypothetical protein